MADDEEEVVVEVEDGDSGGAARPRGAPRWEVHDGQRTMGPLEEEHVVRMIAGGLPAASMARATGEKEWRSLRTHVPFAMALDRPKGMPPAPVKPWQVAMVVGVGVVVVCGAWVGIRAYVVAQADSAEQNRLYHERREQAAQRIARLPELRRRVTSTRFDGLDGQCAGKGAPPHGWIYQGATYDENEAVGRDDGCQTFGTAGVPNITNFFCCPQR